MTKSKDVKRDAICLNCRSGIIEEKLDGFYHCQNPKSDHYGHLLYEDHGCGRGFSFRPYSSHKLSKITTRSPSSH